MMQTPRANFLPELCTVRWSDFSLALCLRPKRTSISHTSRSHTPRFYSGSRRSSNVKEAERMPQPGRNFGRGQRREGKAEASLMLGDLINPNRLLRVIAAVEGS